MEIRSEPWFEYYIGMVTYLLTLDSAYVREGYESVKEGTLKWVAQYCERRFDEWSALRKDSVRSLCMLLEYPRIISQGTGRKISDVSNSKDEDESKATDTSGLAKEIEPWITVRLKPKSCTVFGREATFLDPAEPAAVLSTLQNRIQLCLFSWPTKTPSHLPVDNDSNRDNNSNHNINYSNGVNDRTQGMASNLPAWILIVQSIQGAIEKVTAKMTTFLQLQSQRQLSSRSRKQLEAMKPLVPGWLGMLAGCLAMVEHFVLVRGPPVSLEMKHGAQLLPLPCSAVVAENGRATTKGKVASKGNVYSSSNNRGGDGAVGTEGPMVDRSSAAEIRLRLAIVNFLNKFVSNFERVKLPTIEAAWEDLLKTVDHL